MPATEEIKSLKIFSGLNPTVVDILAERFTSKSSSSGEILCTEGESNNKMYVVVSGEVEVLRSKRKDGEDEVAAVLSSGDVVGEMSLIAGKPANATVRTRGSAELLVFGRHDLDRLKQDEPIAVIGLYEGIIRQMAARFRGLSDKKDVLSFWFG